MAHNRDEEKTAKVERVDQKVKRKEKQRANSPHKEMPIIIGEQCMVNIMIFSCSNFQNAQQRIPWMRKLAMNESKLSRVKSSKSNKRPVIDKPAYLMGQEQRNQNQTQRVRNTFFVLSQKKKKKSEENGRKIAKDEHRRINHRSPSIKSII